MYHDGKFTYIQAHQEPPALYEVKEGKPNLIQFEFHSGKYVVSKVLADGISAYRQTEAALHAPAGGDKRVSSSYARCGSQS